MSEHYNLSWTDFENCASETFRKLIDDKDFIDVTLACDDGKSVKAHKIVLSSASSMFKTILTENPHQHPLIYLKGIRHKELRQLMSFIYLGEVEVAESDLANFMETASELKIKGLQDTHANGQSKTKSELKIGGQGYVEMQTESLVKDETQIVEVQQHMPENDFEMNTYNETGTYHFLNLSSKDKDTGRYSCDECNYQTVNATNLKRHKVGKHAGIKFPCVECDGQFSSRDNLKRHCQSKHYELYK